MYADIIIDITHEKLDKVFQYRVPEELEKELEEAGVKVEKGNYLPYAFTISNLNYLGKIAAFRQGKFAVQDESSQLAVAIADINEGDIPCGGQIKGSRKGPFQRFDRI